MRWASMIVLSGLVACGDGTIGGEHCVAFKCEARGFELTPLVVQFSELRTRDALPLPTAKWEIANPCSTPCDASERALLFPAGNGSVFNIVRHGAPPSVQLISAEAQRTEAQLSTPASASPSPGTYAVGSADGRLWMHAQWPQPGTSQPLDELASWVAGQPVQRSMLAVAPSQRRPLGAIPGAPGSYLLFDSNIVTGEMLSGSVRLIAQDGAVHWQRGGLPSAIAIIGGSAAWDGDHYVVTARNASAPATSSYALVWLDAAGGLERATTIYGANWRSARLLDRGPGSFVALGRSDLESGASLSNSDTTGNIDIVAFRESEPLAAWRLRRDCFFELEIRGFTVDAAGTMFVSTQAGVWDEPRGLLCRLPEQGQGVCYQSEPMQLLGALAAIGTDSLVAELNDRLVRIDLP